MRPRHDDHVLDLMHAEGGALISLPSHSFEYQLPVAGLLASRGGGLAGKRAAQDVAMTALPHVAFGIDINHAEGGAFRVPVNR